MFHRVLLTEPLLRLLDDRQNDHEERAIPAISSIPVLRCTVELRLRELTTFQNVTFLCFISNTTFVEASISRNPVG